MVKNIEIKSSPEETLKVEESTLSPGDTPDTVKADAKEGLSESPENLFPKESLKRVGATVGQAKETAKDVLGVSEIALPGAQNLIKEFQKKNGLIPDGKAGADTYEKMLEIDNISTKLIQNSENGFDKFGLSYETLEGISNILPNMMYQSKNYQRLSFLVGTFKSSSKFEKNQDPEYKKLLRKITGGTNEVKKQLENSKDSKSFYEIIKDDNISWDEKIKKIATDPTALMVGGLLFLFGVIGGDSKYTDSFMKRIGWMLGISMFGPAAWNKIGGNEMLEDMKNAGSSIYDNIKDTAENNKGGIGKFFTDDLKTIYGDIKDFEYSDILSKIGNKFNDVTIGFASYNEEFKGEKPKDNKTGYIKEDSLAALVGLMADESFLNTPKEDLKNISDHSTLNNYISDETQAKLKKAGVNADDIKNFIKKHLLENAFGKEKDAVFVKDLLLTTPLKKAFNEKFKTAKETYYEETIELGSYVEGNDELNNEIKKIVGTLTHSSNKEEKELGTKLAIAIQSGEIDKFDPKGNKEIVAIVKKIQDYTESKKELDSRIKEITDISLDTTGGNTDTQESLEKHLNDLNSINHSKLNGTFKDKFEAAKKIKDIEIFEAARDLGILKLGTINVLDQLNRISNEAEIIKDKETLEAIKIENIPNKTNSPKEFKEFLYSNKENFEKIAVILKKYKDSGNELTQRSLDKAKKIKQFVTKYNEMKVFYITKINDIKAIVNKPIAVGTLSIEDIKLKKAELKKQSDLFAKIVGESTNSTLDDAKTYLKLLYEEYVLDQPSSNYKSNNIFEILDKELGSSSNRPDLADVGGTIAGKIYELESKYELDIANITDIKLVDDFVKEIEKKSEEIDKFDNKGISTINESKLKEEVKKVITLYLNAINLVKNDKDLDKIYTSYDNNLFKKVGPKFIFFGGLIEGNKIKEEYDKKGEELKLEKENIKKTKEEKEKKEREAIEELNNLKKEKKEASEKLNKFLTGLEGIEYNHGEMLKNKEYKELFKLLTMQKAKDTSKKLNHNLFEFFIANQGSNRNLKQLYVKLVDYKEKNNSEINTAIISLIEILKKA